MLLSLSKGLGFCKEVRGFLIFKTSLYSLSPKEDSLCSPSRERTAVIRHKATYKSLWSLLWADQTLGLTLES